MIKFQKGDITKIKVDVIINAANTQLKHGGGVAKAIAKAAGPDLEKESRKIKYCPLGSFAITTAGKLLAKKVIHFPTIDYQKNGERISYQTLKKVWQKILKFCQEKGYRKIATPLLGTGVVGLDAFKVKEILSQEGEKFKNLEIIIVEK
jgi:O-acetyl-ADP-ribose deacetylase (regulator of RNase III)